ncbi:MAG TPA: sugar ABC transporter permease [Spirochaetia bacterium]|nr:sugar ABC transporter permease [Spirochaetia bacterium]
MAAKAGSSRPGIQRIKEARTAWLMSAPAILLLLAFLVAPFILAIGFSFTDQRLIPNVNIGTSFVGIRNFFRLLSDSTFHRAILNNFYFAAVVVPIQTALALAMAMLVNLRMRFTNVFRTIYFSPVVITMVVVSIVWYLLYNPEEGFINQALNTVTFGAWPNVRWLQSTAWALPAIMILSIWQGVGFQMIIFLAGLQDIPDQLYEVADMDGATNQEKFWYVTLPMLRNTTLFVVISTTILAFKLFKQVWVMTQGGPQESTTTAIVMMYRQGFQRGSVGYASAIAVLFFVIVLIVSMIQRTVLKEERAVE